MKGIKVILVPTLLIVLCNSKPGKMRVLPEPVVPSQFQRSKFLYDSKNEKTNNGDGKKVDEQSTCKKESEALGFPERTVIGVAGREPEEIFINFKFKTPLSLAAIIIGCWLSQGGLYLFMTLYRRICEQEDDDEGVHEEGDDVVTDLPSRDIPIEVQPGRFFVTRADVRLKPPQDKEKGKKRKYFVLNYRTVSSVIKTVSGQLACKGMLG